MKARAHIVINGIVQGVYFRDFTLSQAKRSGITGWVRNLPDGRVEAMAEGEKGDLEHFIEHLWTGPPSSRVDDTAVEWDEYTGSFTNFQISF